MLKKPQNVYLPIDKFQAKVFKNGDNAKKGEWVTNFALALAEEAEDGFAKELLRKAQADLYKDIVRNWRFTAKRSLEASGVMNPTDLQVHEKCIEDFGDEYVEALELLTATSKRIRDNVNKRLDMSYQEDSGARESQRRAGADSVRGTPSHSAPARSSGTMPADVQVVYDFAAAENLDPVDAYECWNVTVNERDGKTADGKRITNWKAYVRKWCVTRASNRRTA